MGIPAQARPTGSHRLEIPLCFKMRAQLCSLVVALGSVHGWNVAQSPMLGWNCKHPWLHCTVEVRSIWRPSFSAAWNHYGCSVNATILMNMASAMAKNLKGSFFFCSIRSCTRRSTHTLLSFQDRDIRTSTVTTAGCLRTALPLEIKSLIPTSFPTASKRLQRSFTISGSRVDCTSNHYNEDICVIASLGAYLCNRFFGRLLQVHC
jgi:hypothetical protein